MIRKLLKTIRKIFAPNPTQDELRKKLDELHKAAQKSRDDLVVTPNSSGRGWTAKKK